MIKYTILYKNGKTWNGKAKGVANIPVVPCILLVIHCKDGAKKLYYMDGYSWEHFEEMNPSHVYERTPNPKSKTKKQKAFYEAYEEWAKARRPDVYIWGSGHAEYSIQAYKKWLWEQKNEKVVKVDKDGFIPWNGGEMPVPKGAMVHVKLRSGKEVICTAGYHPSSKQFKRLSDNWLYANDWSHDNEPGDIVAYKVYEENLEASEPNLDWWKDPSLGNFKVALYTSNTPTKPGYPIKSTYTFWLGANGEIVDDK